MSSWSPTQQSLSLACRPCAYSLRNPLQTIFPPALLLTQPGAFFFFELVNIFTKITSLALGTSLPSFSLFTGPVLKFHSVGTSVMRNFDMFSQRWSFLFPDTRLTWRRLGGSYSLNWFQDFLHRVFPRHFLPWETIASECCDTQPNCDTQFTTATAFLSSLYPFLGSVFFFCFFWLFINRVMRKQTLVSSLRTRFTFYRIGIRSDANIHNAFACRYLSNNICTVVEEWTHGNFCLGYFSSSTHNDLVIRLDQRVWRQCVLVFVHDLGFVTETASVSLQTLAFFSTSNRYQFLLQRRLIPFDSWPLVLIQFSHACMASKFRNRSFWSILLFTIIFNFW